MLFFLAIVMGPGLGFMLFALSQFWREARQFRFANPRTVSGVVTVRVATNPLNGTSDEHAPSRAPETSDGSTISEEEPEPARIAAAGDQPARAKVVTTYLKNRLAVIPSGTGRLAVKRVAKRSS